MRAVRMIPDIPALQTARDYGNRVLHIVATLEDEVMMPAVRTYMLFTALADCGELIGSVPSQAGVEQFAGREVQIWLASEDDEESVAQAARAISDVKSVLVREDTGDRQPPQVDPVEPEQPPAEPATGAVPAAAAAPAREDVAASQAARTVRVDAERLDQLMHLMGELVIHRTAVEAHTANIDSPELQHAVQNLTRSSQALQSMVMQVRMIPVDVVFMRFPRVVRDLSTKLGKEVELELLGRETELDRTVVDALGDPLVHLVRNSLDHGLEPAETRLAAGKPKVGKLTISARHAGGSVVIEVRDDGRGVDPQAIARKAASAGLIEPDQAAGIDMRGAIELLFQAGFSTAETTSDVSGRGVGMDAVRAKIRALGGEVLMESTLGVGTLAQIRLPLTLAIVSALQIDVAGASFAIPIDRVERTLRLDPQSVRSVAGRRMLDLDTGVLPLLEGASTFERTPLGTHQLAVIVRGGDRRIGLAVDQLVGQRELVTRPLPAIVSDGQPVSGGAVLADGQIALIVDCDALVSRLLAPNGGSPRPTQIAA